MHTSLLYQSTFDALLTLLYLPTISARIHQLPHQVYNITGTPKVEATPEPSICVPSTTTEFATYTQSCPVPTSTRTIHSIVFPSADAAPIEITSQSQVITSFLPQMTWCVPDSLVIFPMSAAPYLNASTSYTTVVNSTNSCETIYAPLETTVCATTLTALASKVTITDCTQEVTFSSETGFSLETPTPTTSSNTSLVTPTPTVKPIFTYWLAPWQALTAGEAPSDVEVKVCSALESGDLECSRYQEVWEVNLVTKTLTIPTTMEFFATVTGPGTMYVQTSQSIISDTVETIEFSSALLLETAIETESTSTGRKTGTRRSSIAEPSGTDLITITSGTSTVYITKTVLHIPTSTSEPDSSSLSDEPGSTSTLRVTSTITRTSTQIITRLRPSSI